MRKPSTNERNGKMDILKAVAMIAVVSYHIGGVEYGYLGSDVFFVINGFLVVRSILHTLENRTFTYLKFLKKKLLYLWPIVLMASITSLIIGFFVMLPDDYENLAESVVASNFFQIIF